MFHAVDIEKETLENTDYRRVLYTPGFQQLVLMSIPPKQDIPLEVHADVDQFFRFESGEGEMHFGKNEEEVIKVKDGSGVTVKHGTYHRVLNTGDKDLKLYSIYSPPEHPPNRVDKFRPEENNKYEKLMSLLLMI